MATSGLKLVVPDSESGTVQRPNRIANDKLRGRDYLTEAEISRLEKKLSRETARASAMPR